MCLVSFESWELIFCSLYQADWQNLMKQSVTVGAQLLWGGRYGCNNGRYGCTIVMSYIEINKAVSQWLLTFNLCISVTWPLTCAFHIPCTHTPEIIDLHRGVCDNCGGHHRLRGKTPTGSALDGAVFDIAQMLAYLVHNMSRSQLYLGFGHFGWLLSFFGQ